MKSLINEIMNPFPRFTHINAITMSTKSGLYKKILAVMEAVPYLEKDDDINFKSKNGHTTKYKALSIENAATKVSKAMREVGLVCLPVKQTRFVEGDKTTIDVVYKIIDTDTGEFEELVSSGSGVDQGDKAVGKAMTYSRKYLYCNTFHIASGDDPDKTPTAQLLEEAETPPPVQTNVSDTSTEKPPVKPKNTNPTERIDKMSFGEKIKTALGEMELCVDALDTKAFDEAVGKWLVYLSGSTKFKTKGEALRKELNDKLDELIRRTRN